MKKLTMNTGLRTGVSFGLTSGVITTLGLMIGLNAGTSSTVAVIGGIITIAIADAMSDALGIHISKEAEEDIPHNEVWVATFATFVTKMLMALTFVIPVLLFSLTTAMFVAIGWGLLVLAVLSYIIAKAQGDNPLHTILEHVSIAIAVVIITHYVGEWVAWYFV